MYSVHGFIKWWGHYGKQYGGPSKKKKIGLPYEPTISLLGIYLKEMKTLPQKKFAAPCS